MLGCILIAFNLCAPPGYGGYGYQQYYQQPQVVYVQQPVYYAQPIYAQPYYGGYGYGAPFGGLSVAVGPRGGVRIGVR